MLTDEDKKWMTDLLNEKLGLTKGELSEQLRQHREESNERLEQVETRLLTEFHKWASPAEMRARSHSAILRTLDLELELLADRVSKLEGGRPKT